MYNLFSIVESPAHPDLGRLYRRTTITETRLSSVRKAIQELKKQVPDIVVADFLYGYGNNYAGVNVSNLDVFLYSLQKYNQQCRVILLVEKAEQPYVEKLSNLFKIDGVLHYPVNENEMESLLMTLLNISSG